MRNKLYWGLATLILLLGAGAVVHQMNAETTVDLHIASSEKLITDGD